MKVVLGSGETYHVLENKLRKMIIITCSEDFELDNMPYSGNTIIQYREFLGEPASQPHYIKNLSSVNNTCYISEYFEGVLL